MRQQIRRRATEERREPRPTERFHALPKEVPARLQIEPFAFQAERHVRQIPHGRILAAVIGAEVMIGRGGIHGVRSADFSPPSGVDNRGLKSVLLGQKFVEVKELARDEGPLREFINR